MKKWLTARPYRSRQARSMAADRNCSSGQDGGNLPLALSGYAAAIMSVPHAAIPGPRRLSDKLLAAFDQACAQDRVEVAELVLKAIEIVVTQEAAATERERRSHLGPV